MELQRDFELRQKVYEDREAFYEVASSPQSSDTLEIDEETPLEDSAELASIEHYTTQGRQKLVDALAQHRTLQERTSSMHQVLSELTRASRATSSAVDLLDAALRQTFAMVELGCGADDDDRYVADAMKASIQDAVERAALAVQDHIAKDAISERTIHCRLRRLGKLYGVLHDASVGYSCPICFARPVDVFLDCGHTQCSVCPIPRQCYICRAPVRRPRPLFFTGPV
jgi:hypothetical protein